MNENIEQEAKENTKRILEMLNEDRFNDLKEKLKSPELLANIDCRIQCAMRDSKPKYKTDCYFYVEIQDMGAHIPTCNYYGKLGFCKCENCPKYISSKEVFRMVKEKVDKENVRDET